MGMIQIDIPMPKCCDNCVALDDHGDYPFCLISQDQRGYTFNTREKRMPTCPLKEQEPVEPIENAGFYYCGACRHAFTSKKQKFCSDCGRAVKWE